MHFKHLFLFLLLLPVAFAQCPVDGSGCGIDYGQKAEGNAIDVKGYHIELLRPERLLVSTKIAFPITVTQNGTPVSDLDLQGQIVDPESLKEVFFGNVEETEPGTYQMHWTPGFAGDYYLVYIFRENETLIKPFFDVSIVDPRADYAWYILLALGILSILVGGYFAFQKKFAWKPLAYGIGLGALLIFLGYSVSVFYESGGERGFVICGNDGCDLAIHWHTQLSMSVCGEGFHLPLEAGDLDRVHTHKERDYLHFHSLVKTDPTGNNILTPEQLYIGDMFKQLDIPFNSTCFDGKCNGDICENTGEPGQLKMTVNDIPNTEFDEYSYKDGDEIHITFE